MTDDREPFREARAAGLKARHEQRLENATYTAAEVKVLTETASKVAYALGRKDAGEEIALALEAIPATVYPEDIFLPDSTSVDAQSARVMRFAYPAAARIARDVVSEEPQDATSGRTDPGMDSDLPQEPRTGSKRVPGVHKPFPDDGVTYCGWHSGNGVVHEGCGEVWPCSAMRNRRNPNREDT